MKDLRDPRLLGEELLRQHAKHPGESVGDIYDEFVANAPIPMFKEESHYAVQHRRYEDSPTFSFTSV